VESLERKLQVADRVTSTVHALTADLDEVVSGPCRQRGSPSHALSSPTTPGPSRNPTEADHPTSVCPHPMLPQIKAFRDEIAASHAFERKREEQRQRRRSKQAVVPPVSVSFLDKPSVSTMDMMMEGDDSVVDGEDSVLVDTSEGPIVLEPWNPLRTHMAELHPRAL
jgi:hypothetical protein